MITSKIVKIDGYSCLDLDSNDNINELLKQIKLSSDPEEVIYKYVLGLENISELTLTNLNLSNGFGVYLEKILNQHQNLTTLDLSHNKLSNPSMHYLARAIKKHPSINSLNLDKNNITGTGIHSLSKGFAKNKSLKCVNLSNNEIPVDYLECLLTSLKNITLLYLFDNKFNCKPAIKYFTSFVKSSNLELLHLSFSNKDLNFSSLFDAVYNSKISNFCLRACELDDSFGIYYDTKTLTISGAKFKTNKFDICKALTNNSNLITLSLTNIEFNDDQINIYETLKNNTSIKSFTISDHISSQQKLDKIINFIKNNNTLELLHITNRSHEQFLNFDGIIECLTMNSVLKDFKISGVNYDQDFVDKIATLLYQNNTLESLDLDKIRCYGNTIFDYSNLCKSLTSNCVLKIFRMIDIIYNQGLIDGIGTILENNNTLKYLLLNPVYYDIGDYDYSKIIPALENNYTILDFGIHTNLFDITSQYVERNKKYNENRRFINTKAIIS